MTIFIIAVAVHARYSQGGQCVATVEADTLMDAFCFAAAESIGWGDWTIQEAIDSCSVIGELYGFSREDSAEPRLMGYAFIENA